MNLHNSMGYLLNTSAKLMKREFDSKLASYDLTTSQWAVLMVLAKTNGLSQVEIAAKLNADKATCGTILDKMIKKHMIEKRLSDKDKRAFVVYILPSSIKLLDTIIKEAILCNEKATQGLSKEEIELYQKFLVTTIKNLGGNLL